MAEVRRGYEYEGPLGAFGELLTAELKPEVAVTFGYPTVNQSKVKSLANGGTVTIANSMLTVSSGAGANQAAHARSVELAHYQAGQGMDCRFTCVFTAGAEGNMQLAGVGDPGEGFFFGYNGNSFGVLHRYAGYTEVRSFQVTTASSTAENITITLDGDADATVAVTASGVITTTANEIASHDFGGLGDGWETFVEGDTVYFLSYTAEPRTGSYSISATTAAGTFTREVTGVTPTEDWTYQADWNKDRADGTQTVPALDFTKGNVFRITYQYLGFGEISFEVEDSKFGRFIPVHAIQYTGTATRPTLDNPTLPISFCSRNTTNTTDIVMKSGSMFAGVQGLGLARGTRYGAAGSFSGVGTSEVPIFTIANPAVFDGLVNRTKVILEFMAASNDHSKSVVFRFYANSTLVGSAFSAVAASQSVINTDSSATASTAGVQLFTLLVASNNNQVINLRTSGSNVELTPGNRLTVTAEATSGTGASGYISFNWQELV